MSCRGAPISATSTRPRNRFASGVSKPRFTATNVIVRSAETVDLEAVPISQSSPEGTSIAITARFPDINEPERTDICYATTNRQNAVRELAKQVDVVLVVGSKNSSNSNRLREVAEHRGVRAYLIDQADEIDAAWLKDVRKVGVTAGASAPEVLVEEVIARLQSLGATSVQELDGEEENIVFAVATDI